MVLRGISPLIWRRILVSSDTSLATLHDIGQIVLAWNDVHLHGCRIHGKEYGSTQLGSPHFDIEPHHVQLADLRLDRGERFAYVYNFIDHWECELCLEAILLQDPRRCYPVGVGGKRAAPPEDCGGPWAHMQMVDQHHVPVEAMAIVATTPEHLLKTDSHTPIHQVVGDPETFREAVDQLDAYRQVRPEYFAQPIVADFLEPLTPLINVAWLYFNVTG